MDKDSSNIKRALEQLVLELFRCNLDGFTQEDLNIPFMSSKFKFSPRNMLYLFLEIEKKFDIIIPQDEIITRRFDSFNNIVAIIERCLKHRMKIVG